MNTTSNKSIKILKPTITTVLHLLGYKYICVMIYIVETRCEPRHCPKMEYSVEYLNVNTKA